MSWHILKSPCFLIPLLLLSFGNPFVIAQKNSNAFWMGTLSNTEFSSSLYANVNDKLYEIVEDEWIHKGALLSENLQQIEVGKDGTIWAVYRNALRISKDKGATWSNESLPGDFYIKTLKFSGDYIYLGVFWKIFRKSIVQNPSNWEEVFNGSFEDFIATPKNVLYVSEYPYDILRSEDNGASWTKTKWSDVAPSTAGLLHTKDETLLVGTYWNGLYYTQDKGDTWTKAEGLPEGRGAPKFFVYNDFVILLAADQKGVEGLYLSESNAQTFSAVNTGLSSWAKQEISSIAMVGDKLYFSAGFRGFFWRNDSNQEFVPINNGVENLKPHDVVRITADSDGGIVVLMSRLGYGPRGSWGLLKSTDNGANWIDISGNFYDEYNTIEDVAVTPNGAIFASGYTPGSIHRSFDNGANWQSLNSAVGSTVSKLEALNNDTLYGCTYWNGVIRTIDAGDTWKEVNVGIPPGKGSIDVHISKVGLYSIISGQDGYDGLYSSNDFGENWVKLSSHPLTKVIRYDDLLFGFHLGSVFVSKDNGVTWEDFSGELPSNLLIYSFIVATDDSEKSGSRYLIVATDKGIFQRNIEQQQFVQVSTVVAQTIFWNSATNEVIVGRTEGVDVSDVESLPNVSAKALLNHTPFAVYPNPAHDMLRIQPLSSDAVISKIFLYTIGGSKLRELRAGNGETCIDVSWLSRGIYVLKVECNSITYTVRVFKN